jgi:hypothetical protein
MRTPFTVVASPGSSRSVADGKSMPGPEGANDISPIPEIVTGGVSPPCSGEGTCGGFGAGSAGVSEACGSSGIPVSGGSGETVGRTGFCVSGGTPLSDGSSGVGGCSGPTVMTGSTSGGAVYGVSSRLTAVIDSGVTIEVTQLPLVSLPYSQGVGITLVDSQRVFL